MTVQEVINKAFERGWLTEPPVESTLFIIVDTDGSIVSVPVTHEFMEDTDFIIKESVTKQLLLKRDALRKGYQIV